MQETSIKTKYDTICLDMGNTIPLYSSLKEIEEKIAYI